MDKVIRIGTRESQLAVWQATTVKEQLSKNGIQAELVFIKSEGDIDLQTPLYEMGVQGVFTRSLDIALLSGKVDIAVHSMKDVPTQLAKGIAQAAVLKRASYQDILVYTGTLDYIEKALGIHKGIWANSGVVDLNTTPFIVATSSIRRKAQWLHRYPHHRIENLRGNVNTRLQKIETHNWNGAIFAAAGLERIALRPANSITLDWMLPAPAQGAIMIVCREEDKHSLMATAELNDAETALCTKTERDFLRTLLGGCSTPISALATIIDGTLRFRGSLLSIDGKDKAEVNMEGPATLSTGLGITAAHELLNNGGKQFADSITNAAG